MLQLTLTEARLKARAPSPVQAKKCEEMLLTSLPDSEKHAPGYSTSCGYQRRTCLLFDEARCYQNATLQAVGRTLSGRRMCACVTEQAGWATNAGATCVVNVPSRREIGGREKNPIIFDDVGTPF